MFTSSTKKTAYKDHYIIFNFDLPSINLSKKQTEIFIYDKYLSYANAIVLELQKDFNECNDTYKHHIKMNGPMPKISIIKRESPHSMRNTKISSKEQSSRSRYK
jgi:hypothetical protein